MFNVAKPFLKLFPQPCPLSFFLFRNSAISNDANTNNNNAPTRSRSCSSNNDQQQQQSNSASSDSNLPFELRATEAVFAAAARRLEGDAAALEAATLPALERLAFGGSVSRAELERVRESKAALSRLLGRASGVKRAIEGILGDPQDMANMYLGRKAAAQAAAAAAAAQAAAESVMKAEEEDVAAAGESSEPALEPLAEEEDAAAAAAAVAAASASAAVAASVPSSSSAAPPTFAVVASSSSSFSSPSAPAVEQASASFRRDEYSRGAFLSSSSLSTPSSHFHHRGGRSSNNGGGGGGEGGISSSGSGNPLHTPLLLDRTRTSLNGGLTRRTTRTSEGGASLANGVGNRGGGWRRGSRAETDGDCVSEGAAAADYDLAAAAAEDNNDDDVRTIAWARNNADNSQDSRAGPDVEGCEDLMDAYAAIVSSTLRRLEALRERAAATEALVRLDLDRRRNELVAFNMTLSMGGLAIALVSAVGSVFGQNLYFSSHETSLAAWHASTWGSTAAAFLLLGALLVYAQRKQLLFIPSTGGMDEEDE